MASNPTLMLHATAVAWDGKAALIIGSSGTGKSALALQLMAYGAALISDDQVCLERQDGHLVATAPEPLKGMIEARFVGLLNAQTIPSAPVKLVVDMDQVERDRLPPFRHVSYLDIKLPLLHKSECAHFPAGILQYLKADRRH